MTLKSPTAQEQIKISAGNNSLDAFLFSLGFNAGLSLFVFLVFCILRPYYPKSFNPRSIILPESLQVVKFSKHPFKWILDLLKIPHEDILAKCGVDSYCLIRFLYIFLRLFTLYAVIFPVLLIPLYVVGQNKLTGLDNASISNLKDKLRIWGQSVSMILITAMTIFMIFKEYKYFLRIRHEYLLNLNTHSRTVLLTNLPEDLRNPETLTLSLNPLPGGIDRIIPCRETSHLSFLINQRRLLVLQLEAFIVKLIVVSFKTSPSLKQHSLLRKTTKKFTSSISHSLPVNRQEVPKNQLLSEVINSKTIFSNESEPEQFESAASLISKYCKKISRLNSKITKLRNILKHSSIGPAVFISFNHPLGARLVKQAINDEGNISVVGNVHPFDIVWENLFIKAWYCKLRTFLFGCFIGFLILFWAVPVTFISSLASLSVLSQSVPFLGFILLLPKWVISFIEGVLPSFLITLLIQLLLKILLLTTRWEGAKRYTDIQLSIMDKYFAFLLVNVLFVITLANGAIQAIKPMLDNPSAILDILSQSMPKVSTFFITFLLFQSFVGQMLELLSPFSTMIIYFKTRGWADLTPRGFLKNAVAFQPIWGWIWPIHTLVIAIVLSYATLAPSILFFAVLYFAMAYLAALYKVSCVYQVKPECETGGLFFVKALQQVFVGVYIFQVIVLSILVLNAQIGPVSVAVITIIATICAHRNCNHKFLSSIEHLPISSLVKHSEPVKQTEDSTVVDMGTDFFQPAGPFDLLTHTSIGGHQLPCPGAVRDQTFLYQHPSLISPDVLPIWLSDIASFPDNPIVPFLVKQIEFIESKGIPVIIGEGAILDVQKRSMIVSIK